MYQNKMVQKKWYNSVPEKLYRNKLVQNSGYKYICRMKKESSAQDLLNFLQLSQTELAEFFNISRELFNKTALGTRKFPFRLNQRRLDMLNLMASIKAEKGEQAAENPSGFSPSFAQGRLVKVENRIRILSQQLHNMEHLVRNRRNALEFYDRMKMEFTDLTPLDLAWIQKERDKISLHLPEEPSEQKRWELKMLRMELEELGKEI
jgi:hypothetical protein